ncbi:C-x8-C-x5-C-x3-H type zinc finger protein [Purpureocillium lavendulum]|uniref:C-x8-C-x5-C-x3-H type zinc finger protein n=1 Tax=Purpureocillium lavendulum TaxID=1247861 RepID=A0AB34G8D1_9HYPO|nr:C-x8-C-x5-C-x3-H type zinc finger protein [Purpureocillium lavendulum]
MATYPPQAGRTISASPRAASNSGDPHTDDDRLDNASPRQGKIRKDSAAPSRASPELGPSEIQGQVFDPTSGFSFLHRAWKRLSSRNAGSIQGDSRTVSSDKPLAERREHAPLQLPDPSESRRLLALYFDVCIATYRVLHHPTVEEWLTIVERNVNQGQPAWHRLGRSRAAVVLAVLAIAATHHEKSKGISSQEDESRALSLSDELFGVSLRLVDVETGPPRLESAQARLVQVLYLLTTSRFNRAWFVFGSALQLISALGLHRRANTKKRKVTREDYVQTQCGLRLFWSAYILDNYLGVVFGRPRHYNDDDIDQVFPDRINDEDMTSIGPEEGLDHLGDCHIDALIFHAKIGKIIGCISREVYTIKDVPEGDRVAAAHRLIQEVDQWRSSLPAYLGSVPPRMLILSYRRQATVLKIAHSHAVMHASRLFLLGDPSLHKNHVRDCVAAARTVLETVDGMAKEGPIFHAFWWTHYVTFCALVVVYIWEIQQRRAGAAAYQSRTSLLNMAERCHTHLAQATATNSPSRRYAVILEEFRRTALGRSISEEGGDDPDAAEQPGAFTSHQRQQLMDGGQAPDAMESGIESMGSLANFDPQQFDGWQMTDFFLDLDSSAFWPHVDVDESMLWSSMGF